MARRFLITLTLIIAASVFNQTVVWARGVGGFRGGGFHGADDFGHGFDNRDDSYYHGDADNYAHADYAGTPGMSATQTYAGGAYKPIASDGAFGRLGVGSPYAAHVTNRVDVNAVAVRGNAVRVNYGFGNVYHNGFWGAHPEADWAYANHWGNDWAWGYSTWPAMAGWWGMSAAAMPSLYDYGNNITYQNDSVYYGSEPVATAGVYYDQAQTLAQSMPVTMAETKSKSDWKTLGVFSMVQGEQTSTTSMFQLAVNKKGAIKGSYYNPLTGETKPVKGAVNKKNMRASWIVGSDNNVVYDTGLSNLLQEQSQLLVHCGKDKTQQWTLVRLQKPAAS